MKSIYKLALAAITASAAITALASAKSISGTVKSFDSEAPLSGAIIRVVGESNQTITDDLGRFRLSNVDSEDQIEASYFGYGSSRLSAQANELEFFLGENVINLDPLLVSGGKSGQVKALNIQRSANNLANIVSADAFGNFPDENAAEALQRISGVSIERD